MYITDNPVADAERCGNMNDLTLLQGDCLELMKNIPDGSVDLVLTDPPYGTTACKWDSVIPFEPMWEQLNRIIKPNGAICLFGSESFSSALRMSNIKNFRYDWIWNKGKESNFMLLKKQPKKDCEIISVFYKKQPTYNPIMEKAKRNSSGNKGNKKTISGNVQNYTLDIENSNYVDSGLRYPSMILNFSSQSREVNNVNRLHPTQKPVALLEYLIKTYTNESETVLDFTMGSGSTGVACVNTGRKFIGMELDKQYFDIAVNRIAETQGEVTENVMD